MNNSTKIVICGMCGFLMTFTVAGFRCLNLKCPEYLCEKHEHVPEKGDTGTAFWVKPDVSVGTTTASGASGSIVPIENLINWKDTEGGENK